MSVLRESLVTLADAHAVVAKLVESAKGGDTQAAAILMDRLWPKARPQSAAFAFPLPDADLATQAQAVIREMSAGNLPIQEAANVLASLSSVARLKQVAEFEERLERLEKRHLIKRGGEG